MSKIIRKTLTLNFSSTDGPTQLQFQPNGESWVVVPDASQPLSRSKTQGFQVEDETLENLTQEQLKDIKDKNNEKLK